MENFKLDELKLNNKFGFFLGIFHYFKTNSKIKNKKQLNTFDKYFLWTN